MVTQRNVSHSSNSERKLMEHLSVRPNVLATVQYAMELEELHVLSVKLVINFKVENVSLIIRHASQDANSALEVQEYKTRQLH